MVSSVITLSTSRDLWGVQRHCAQTGGVRQKWEVCIFPKSTKFTNCEKVVIKMDANDSNVASSNLFINYCNVIQINEIGTLSSAEGTGINVIQNSNRKSEFQESDDEKECHYVIMCCISLSMLQKDLDGGDSLDEGYNQEDTFSTSCVTQFILCQNLVVVVDLPLLRVAVERPDNPISLEKHCQASLPPDQQRHHSLGSHPNVQYAV